MFNLNDLVNNSQLSDDMKKKILYCIKFPQLQGILYKYLDKGLEVEEASLSMYKEVMEMDLLL